MRKIAVIGAGYVGLVTGTCFAQKNNFVIIVEKNEDKINALLKGKIPFYEPKLDVILSQIIKNEKIVFVKEIKEAFVQNPEIVFSCVGTPSNEDGSSNLSYVFDVAKEIGRNLSQYCLVVNKSTVPVGTCKRVESIIKDQFELRGINIKFDVASNPEFLKEGSALDDFLFPNRVVVGVESKRAEELLKELYTPFLKKDDQFLVMNRESSELTKYASNAMLAVRISFINQLALLADKVGADINQIKLGISKDRRIGEHFLNAGIGYGGSCFPKDVKALISIGFEHNQPMTLFTEVEKINENQRKWFIEKVFEYYGDLISSKRIGIWGLSFKPETDDIRCAPSVDIIKQLLNKGTKVIAYDPAAKANIKAIFQDQIFLTSQARDVLRSSDALLILSEWKEFLSYKTKDFAILKDRVVFDGRNCFDPISMLESGIRYFSVGRNSVVRNFDLSNMYNLRSKNIKFQEDF